MQIRTVNASGNKLTLMGGLMLVAGLAVVGTGNQGGEGCVGVLGGVGGHGLT